MKSKKLCVSIAGVLAAAGLASSASGALTITPADVITWVGRATPTPAGFTWTWSNSNPESPSVMSSGRVFFQGFVTSTPAIGSIGATQGPRGLFTATSAANLTLFNNTHDGADLGGGVTQGVQNSTGVFNITGFGTTRVSGGVLGGGFGFFGTGISNSGASQNNTYFATGSFAGGLGQVQQRNDGITLKDASGADATGFQNFDFRQLSTQSSSLNSSGTFLWSGGVAAAAGSGGGVGQFVTTNTTTAPFGNSGFIAMRDSGGTINILAQAGQATPGGGFYQNTTSGSRVGGFNIGLNRNGQAWWDARLLNTGLVTSTNDDRAFIHTPGSGTVQVYREGTAAPDATGAPDAGGALFSAGVNVGFRSFSNAGLLFLGNLATGTGDVNTGALTNNSSGLYIATATGTTRVLRRNDVAPGFTAGDNVRVGQASSSNTSFNNNGFLATATSLQGEGVTISQNAQFSFPPNQVVTATGVYGNDSAIIAGTPGNLSIIARRGDAAPGLPGFTLAFSSSAATPLINNANQVIFDSDTSLSMVGDILGVVGAPVSEVLNLGGPRVMLGWGADFGLVPLLYSGQTIEVETGVFRTVSTWTVNTLSNGDGGALGFNDNGRIATRVSFVEGGWSVITLQIPAPASGALALLGFGAMARRRRRN